MANIIPFPESSCRIAQAEVRAAGQLTLHRAPQINIDTVQPARPAAPGDVAGDRKPNLMPDAPDGNVVLRALAECEAARQCGNAPLPDMAWVIRSAMPWIKRRGRNWSSLPELHRRLLDQHCAAGDPTARMFCDWIEGRHLDRLAPCVEDARATGSSPSDTAIRGGL